MLAQGERYGGKRTISTKKRCTWENFAVQDIPTSIPNKDKLTYIK